MPAEKTPFFLPYQEKWIRDRSRIKIMEKARQIGLTWASAYNIVRQHSLSNTRYDAWVSSRDEAQARLFLEDCKRFAHVLDIAATDISCAVLDPQTRASAFSLGFKNNRKIHSLSSNPDAQAGKRGARILDEFALHPDPHRLYSVAYPGITWGGSLEIISTHRGTQNFFNKLIQEVRHNGNPKGISLHRVTLEDALNQGFLRKLKEKLPQDDARQGMDEADYYNYIKDACPDEETFMEEYMCQPFEDNSAFIDYNLLDQNEYPPGHAWETSLPLPGDKDFYLGADLGRTNDLTVFWLIEKVEDIFYTRKIITLQNMPFDQQAKIFDELVHSPGIRRVCIDQTGLGRHFAEQAISRHGPGRVEGITFTGPIKEAMAYPLKSAMEKRAFRIPSDPVLRADFRAIKKETTLSGNIRFSADRGKNGHSDRFWAAALALHAAKSKHVNQPHYESLTRSNSNFF